MVLFENPAIATYALTSSIVALQLIGLAFWTGTTRVRRKQFVNAEDARANKVEVVDVESEEILRLKRAHANLLENAVPFFIVGALFAATNPTRAATLAYLWTFVVARVLHSIVYLWGRQPFRTICFVVGALATIGMALHVIRAVA